MQVPTRLRMTRQRQAILDALRKTDAHPTADEVYQAVRAELPHISLGTVYRNLSLLAREGLVNQLENGSGPGRFDGDQSNHYHIRCLLCDRVADARIASAEFLEESVREVSEYAIEGHRLEFTGFCPECQAAQLAKTP